MEACTLDRQLNGKQILFSPFIGKKSTFWPLIMHMIMCLCVGAHKEVQVLVETRKGCLSPWCWSSRYWTQVVCRTTKSPFQFPVLEEPVSKRKRNKLGFKQQIWEPENQTRPLLWTVEVGYFLWLQVAGVLGMHLLGRAIHQIPALPWPWDPGTSAN